MPLFPEKSSGTLSFSIRCSEFLWVIKSKFAVVFHTLMVKQSVPFGILSLNFWSELKSINCTIMFSQQAWERTYIDSPTKSNTGKYWVKGSGFINQNTLVEALGVQSYPMCSVLTDWQWCEHQSNEILVWDTGDVCCTVRLKWITEENWLMVIINWECRGNNGTRCTLFANMLL